MCSARCRTVTRAGGAARRPRNVPTTLPRVPDLSLERDILLPPISACTHFVNLTNGLEAVPHLAALGIDYKLVRCLAPEPVVSH